MGNFPIIMKKILNFGDNKNCNLRSGTHLSRSIVHKTHYRAESTANLGAKILELVPQNIKEGNSLSSCKSKFKKRIPKNCSCRLCKTNAAQVLFI